MNSAPPPRASRTIISTLDMLLAHEFLFHLSSGAEATVRELARGVPLLHSGSALVQMTAAVVRSVQGLAAMVSEDMFQSATQMSPLVTSVAAFALTCTA